MAKTSLAGYTSLNKFWLEKETKTTRRNLAHIVGGTAELRALGRDLFHNARRGYLAIRDTGAMARGVKLERIKSRDGIPVDYQVVSTDPGASAQEFGFRLWMRGKNGPQGPGPMIPGRHIMRNALPGSPQARARLKKIPASKLPRKR